ncbi:pyridoxal phosphate-dependent aminotransferase [Bifidobacterium thermophilum]|uniref:pyridoxal phosphate-dependent aminotransferase n=1 Tax=Bifidobacterium thermophilum TaxID=33905 RepID=UPI003991890E
MTTSTDSTTCTPSTAIHTHDPASRPSPDRVIPQAIARLAPSAIRAFDAEVSQIPGIIKLTLGEPDFPTPEFIKRAAARALDANRTHYAPNAGTEGLRTAISAYLARRRGLAIPSDRIIVTTGASEALSSTLGTLLAVPGAELIEFTPAFGQYASLARIHGAKLTAIDTTGNGFHPDPTALDRALDHTHGPAVVILNSPSNPTGTVASEDELRDLARIIDRHDAIAVSDEVYAEISFEHRPAPSIAKFIPERTVVIDSASKTYAMTGWRLGWLAAPAWLAPAILKYHQLAVSCAATFSMDAAQEAYEHGDTAIETMVDEYRARRDFLAGALNAAGYQTANPQGAFYLYVKAPERYADGLAFARDLAQHAKVAAIPGTAFASGPSPYVRFSYAAALDTLRQAAERIRTFTDSRGNGHNGQ